MSERISIRSTNIDECPSVSVKYICTSMWKREVLETLLLDGKGEPISEKVKTYGLNNY